MWGNMKLYSYIRLTCLVVILFFGTYLNCINIQGTSEDITTLNSMDITVNKIKVFVGEEIIFNVNPSDTTTEIRNISLILVSPNSELKNIEFTVTEQAESYSIPYIIDQTDQTGEWWISQIIITDNNGNRKEYFDTRYNISNDNIDTSGSNFEIISRNDILDYFKLSKTSVIPGDTLNISAKLKDTHETISHIDILMSGLSSTTSYIVENTTYTFGQTIRLEYDEISDTFTKNIEIDNTFVNGDYFVYKIVIYDNTENYISSIEPQNIWLNVSQGYESIEPIIPTKITLSDNTVTFGDSIKIVVNIDLNVAYDSVKFIPTGTVYLNCSEPKKIVTRITYNEINQTLEGEITINENFSNGMCEIELIKLGYIEMDIDNSSTTYTTDYIYNNDNLINVSGVREPDTSAPKISTISINNDTFEPGDTLAISIELLNNEVAVNGTLSFSNRYYKYLPVDLFYNDLTKKLEGQLMISEEMLNGNFVPEELQIYDKYDNKLKITNFDHYNLDFTVINSKDVSTIPSINNLYQTKTDVIYGDVVHFIIYLDNPNSIPSFGQLKIIGPKNDMRNISFRYNENTKNLEGEFIIDANMSNGEWVINNFEIASYDNIQYPLNNDMIFSGTILTVAQNSDTQNYTPFLVGIENNKVYHAPRKVEFNGGRVELDFYPIPSGYVFDRNGEYNLWVLDKYGNYFDISFTIALNITDNPIIEVPVDQPTLTVDTTTIITPTLNHKPKDLLSTKPTHLENIDLLLNMLNGNVKFNNKYFIQILQNILKVDQDFFDNLSDKDLIPLTDKLNEIFHGNIRLNIEGDVEINVEGIKLNTDYKRLINGDQIDYRIVIDDEISKEDQEIVNTYIDNQNLKGNPYYSMDIKVFQKIDGVEKQLTNLNRPLSLTLPIPTELKDLNDLKVIRIYDGEINVLDVTINNDGTYTFISDKFSSFSLISTIHNNVILDETSQNNHILYWVMGSLILFSVFIIYFLRMNKLPI